MTEIEKRTFFRMTGPDTYELVEMANMRRGDIIFVDTPKNIGRKMVLIADPYLNDDQILTITVEDAK